MRALIGQTQDCPEDPWRTRLAIMLHDRGFTNAEIGRRIAAQGAIAYRLILRWREWVRENPLRDIRDDTELRGLELRKQAIRKTRQRLDHEMTHILREMRHLNKSTKGQW